jgi:hypothetical protein
LYLLMMSAGDLQRFLANALGQERGAAGTESEAEAKSEVKAKPPAAGDLLRFLERARARRQGAEAWTESEAEARRRRRRRRK